MKQLFQKRARVLGPSSVWRHRDLRIVAAGRAVSFLGDEIAIIALLLRIHDSGAGTTGVAALLLAAALPTVLLAPWAGRLGDTHDSRVVLVSCGLVQAALCVALAFAGPLLLMLALVAALQSVQAVAGPAWAALVPSIVEPAETGRAVGGVQALAMLAGIAGPAVAGLLVAVSGTTWPLLVDAATFAVLAAAGAAVRTRRGGRAATSDTPKPRALDGWRILRSDTLLFPLLLGLLAFVVCGEITNVVEVFLVRDALGAGPQAFGLLGALFAVGATAGAVLGGRSSDDQRRATVAVVSALAAAILTVAGGLAPTVAVFAAVWLLTGLSVGAINVSISTLVVVRSPERSRAQVVASLSGLTRGSALVATLIGGLLGLVAGPRVIYVAAGLAAIVVALAMTAAVRRSLRLPAVPGAQRRGDLVEATSVEG